MMLSPLQGTTWRRVQEAEGRRVLSHEGEDWTAQAIVEERRFGRYLYCPYGPVARDDEAFDDALHWLFTQAQLTRSWFLRVEPPSPSGWLRPPTRNELSRRRAVLQRRGFRRAARNLQPLRTRCLDLSVDESELLGAMTGTNRTLHRSTAKRGLTIEASHDPRDMRHLLHLLSSTAQRQDFRNRDSTHLTILAETTLPTGASTLFLARHGDQVLSANLAIDDGGVRMFLHGASDPAHRKLRAQQSLMVAAILDARQHQLEAADLFGIAPSDDPDHPWAGFTRFKASFGGHVLEHLGAWDLPLRPIAYRTLRAVQNIR